MAISSDSLAHLRALADHGDQMAKLLIQIFDGEDPQSVLVAKHAVAVATPTVHQQQDPAAAGDALVGGDTITVACLRAATLHAALVAHAADGGASSTYDAPHKVAHTGATVTALKAAGAPTDLPTLITWIGLAKDFIIAHGNAAGVHFSSDTGAGGTGFMLTTDPPTTQAEANADLNDIQTAYNAHVALASVVA